MKKLLSGLSLILFVTACGTNNISPNVTTSSVVEKDGNVIADVGNGQKGANFSVKINFASLKTKANVNGTTAKTSANVARYLVYLIKNPALGGYPDGGDPIADRVAGPFTITYNGSGSKLVTFANVGSSSGQAYYAAVRAQDLGNIDIIKNNNGSATAWGSSTADVTLKFAVSNSAGIVVDNNLQANTPDAMTVTPNLLDAIGAILEANVTPNDGSSLLPAVTGS